MTNFTIEYSLILNLKSFISSNFLYKSNFCVVHIHVPTKLQNWKSAKYLRCPAWYISRYMSSPVHWIPKNVVTFFEKDLRRLQTGSRPSSHHSEVRGFFQLCTTKDVAFHTCRGFFTYSATSRVFFVLLLWKLSSFLLPQVSGKSFAERISSRFQWSFCWKLAL